MKNNLPSVNFLSFLLLIGLWLGASGVQSKAEPPSGRQLLKEASRYLAAQHGFEARVRQKASLFGQYLVGSGYYQQVLHNGRLHWRLEMKLKAGEQVTSLLQVSDGANLWIRRGLPDASTIGYVSLARLKGRAVEQPGLLPKLHLAGVHGGLQQLLTQLADNFEFGDPKPVRIGELEAWKIEGRWRAARIERYRPATAEDGWELRSLPEHFPNRVTITLGKDRTFPLFPYRLEYFRDEAAVETTRVRSQSLATIELFELRQNHRQNLRLYRLETDDVEVLDRTEEYLERLAAKQQVTK